MLLQGGVASWTFSRLVAIIRGRANAGTCADVAFVEEQNNNKNRFKNVKVSPSLSRSLCVSPSLAFATNECCATARMTREVLRSASKGVPEPAPAPPHTPTSNLCILIDNIKFSGNG